MADEMLYESVVQRAMVHISAAQQAYRDDEVLNWAERTGNVALARTTAWVDALTRSLEIAKQLARVGGL